MPVMLAGHFFVIQSISYVWKSQAIAGEDKKENK